MSQGTTVMRVTMVSAQTQARRRKLGRQVRTLLLTSMGDLVN
jgi:hypothetical protein